MPTIDELLHDLGNASWFSKLNLLQGFHQICMATKDVPKTTFQTHHGHYKYKVMPFGLCNAPTIFRPSWMNYWSPYFSNMLLWFLTSVCLPEKHSNIWAILFQLQAWFRTLPKSAPCIWLALTYNHHKVEGFPRLNRVLPMFHPSLCFHRQLANLPSLKRPIFKWSHEAR